MILMKEVIDLQNENYKSVKKEIKEDIRRWKDIPCSWIGRIKVAKMAILPKVIYTFNLIFIKIPMAFFIETEKSILQFIWKHKRQCTAKEILGKMSNSGGITILTSNYTAQP
jgi:hypothetical protein